MTQTNMPAVFPLDPLSRVGTTADAEYRRRTVQGVLESYHGNYDVLAEAVQNAVDAVEDAHLAGLPQPFTVEITVNLKENWISVLDSGVGMSQDQIASAFAPNVSFKDHPEKHGRDKKTQYRGYKGVGMTFLAYGTDDIIIHSKEASSLTTKARMQYGCAWAKGRRPEAALLAEDSGASPLDSMPRGTFVKIQFSQETRPRSLTKLAPTPEIWETVLRSRTAIGQVLLDRNSLVKLRVILRVVQATCETTKEVTPSFLYPSIIERKPPYRFLDLVSYHKTHAELTKPPADKIRQDGLYLVWDTERISKELTADERIGLEETIKAYSPHTYAFVPYQGSIWGELNLACTGHRLRHHLTPGLMVAVNRQRLADISDIQASRYETFSRNVLVIVHYDGAKPDLGRKTVEVEALDLANKIANRVVQYLAKQRELLRPPGESPTPDQRAIEKDHSDWEFNVKTHAKTSPLHVPSIAFISTPLTEQDVVGLFHQLCALGVFVGIRIYATSQVHTYDCLVEYQSDSGTAQLSYSEDASPFGLSPFALGTHKTFSTKSLTLEFKNNLDGLLADLGDENTNKTFGNIDICVCWSAIGDRFPGYELAPISEANLDERAYPGITHLLRRDGDVHVINLIMLKSVIDSIRAGQQQMPS